MLKIVLSLAAAAISAAVAINYTGTFTFPHQVRMLAYQDKTDCEKDGGSWSDDGCFMNGQDRVEISLKPGKTGAYRVYVTTLGGNAHTCEFEGTGKIVKPGVINAQDEESPECLVTITYAESNAVSVSTKGSCRYFCGANASLDIEKAKRVK